MFARDIGIDLGTANVLIYVKGQGIVLDEPAVVALEKKRQKLLAAGTEAWHMMGRTPGDMEVTRPLQDGVIADFDVTEMMLKHFMDQIQARGAFGKPRILICTPTNITSVEGKAIREAIERSGGKNIYMAQEPKVAAIGAGMEIFEPNGNMVIDMGGGTTDIAVLSMGDVVTASSIKIAGDEFNTEILQYIKRQYKLAIGFRTADNIKLSIATVIKGGRDEEINIRGRDMVTGLPRAITVTSEEIRKAFSDLMEEIVQKARNILESTPPELAADIIDRGITLTGGGALMNGVEKRLEEELQVPVLIAEDPMKCVARGTGIMLEQMSSLGRKQSV